MEKPQNINYMTDLTRLKLRGLIFEFLCLALIAKVGERVASNVGEVAPVHTWPKAILCIKKGETC